ncbi:iron-containing redox enzyme family protein [Catenulispora yoronensis]|uniref:Iron-containing redox enzyme family protein n=1 Tax=Catenulispora yoronensis TaxID=450799 RepID=A0ABP5FE98_9ACTN
MDVVLTAGQPRLPVDRGELSAALLAAFREAGQLPDTELADRADPYGDDLQLALYLCYELHYRSFEGVDDGWEWDPELLRLRAVMERQFFTALRAEAPPSDDVESALAPLLVDPVDGHGVSYFLKDHGELWQLREYAAQRSVYHLKEADPHLWVIPRLTGQAKASMMAVEFDELGGGHAERMHATLFANLMADLGLDPAYGGYVDAASAEMLATANVMSMFALHRSLRGALVGHFAALEITSSPSSRRIVQAMERLGAGPDAVRFYAEHVEADAVHEQVARHGIIGGLLAAEPELAADVVFGISATQFLGGRLADQLIGAWSADRTSLRVPLRA